MKKIILLLCALTLYQYCYCQTNTTKDSIKISRNSVFFELGGNGVEYSINYDRLIYSEKHLKIALTIGSAYHNGFQNSEIYLTPQLNILIGGKLNAEIGFGYTTAVPNPQKQKGFFVLRLGIRHQKPNGGFIWRLAFTPFFDSEGEIAPLIGLSVGYTFKSKHKKTQLN